MSFKHVGRVKCVLAVWTGEGFQLLVYRSSMMHDGRFLGRLEVTLIASKRLLLQVNKFDMGLKATFLRCPVIAKVTGKRALLPVNSRHMNLEILFDGASIVALLAAEPLHLEMHGCDMPLQLRMRYSLILTVRALVRSSSSRFHALRKWEASRVSEEDER